MLWRNASKGIWHLWVPVSPAVMAVIANMCVLKEASVAPFVETLGIEDSSPLTLYLLFSAQRP
jgi:hypothetical protein